MNMRVRSIIAIVVLVALSGGGLWWWKERAEAAATSGQLTGSGTIEAEDVLVTSEVGGRIKALLADEGQEVAAGEALAVIDTALLGAQLDQARAGVSVAEANLAQLRAGPREQDVLVAQAQADQARAARDGAAAAYANAQKMLNDPQELETQVAQARAARDAAQRSLDQVRAGSRAEDIAAADAAQAQAQANVQSTRDSLSLAKTTAEAQVRQAADALTEAQAAYANARNSWQYAQDTGNDPLQPKLCTAAGCKPNKLSDAQRSSYYTQLVQAEAAMHQAESAVQQAVVAAEQARQAESIGIQSAEAQAQASAAARAKLVNGPTRETLAVAQTALANAQRQLDLVLQIRQNPLQLQAAVDASKAQRDAAQAQLDAAEANLDLVKHGARPEQIQAAEAQLAQARAAQRQIEVQLGKTTLSAPRAGLILSRSLHQGEQASPGATIMTIGALDHVRLTLYISETDIGRVRQGQRARVTVDSFPGRTFDGTVTFIAQEAQFTPRNVQTKDQRTTMVFAVRVELNNPNHALKPGMPADATIVE
jgi:multidrug resistance efflux pump